MKWGLNSSNHGPKNRKSARVSKVTFSEKLAFENATFNAKMTIIALIVECLNFQNPLKNQKSVKNCAVSSPSLIIIRKHYV